MAQFFLSRGDKVAGPLTMEQIKNLSENGKLYSTDQIRKDSGPWQPVSQVKGLKVNTSPAPAARSSAQIPALKPGSSPGFAAPVVQEKTRSAKGSITPIIVAAMLLLICFAGVIIYTRGGGSLLSIGFGSSIPYSDFSSAYTANRKAEWDKLVAGKKIVGELSVKALDEMEKAFRKKTNLKAAAQVAETATDMFRTIKTRGLAKLGNVVVGDDAVELYTKVVAKTNDYFSSREAPKVSTDSTSKDEIETRQSEKIRFNLLPAGYLDYFSFAEKPFEDIRLFMTIATEEERKGELEYLICLPLGLEGKGMVPANLDDFALEALDKDSKVLKQGRIFSKIPLVVGKVVEVKGYLNFSSVADIDRVSKFAVVKKPDEAFLAFVGKAQKALDSGSLEGIRALVRTMKPGWHKKFLELAEASLKEAKTTTRLGIVGGLDELFHHNIDSEAFGLLEKLIGDEDAIVSREAIKAVDDLHPCPPQIIQKIMQVASHRKDDGRKAAIEFIQKLDPKVPDNIALFLKAVDNTDMGIRSIAATFLAKAPLEAGQNMNLGARFIKGDQEEVVNAGLAMILKQTESDRPKVMETVVSMLASKFDSARETAEKTFDSFAPFTAQDLPKLGEGLSLETAEPKLRILAVLSGMKSDAKGMTPNIVKLFKDPSETVKVRAISTVGLVHPEFEKVAPHLFEATKDRMVSVKAEAIRTIPALGRDQKTLELLFDSLGEADPLIPRAALEGFAKLKPPVNKDDLPIIGPRLSSPSNPIKRHAFSSLQAIGEPGSIYAKEVADGLDEGDQEIVLSALQCAQKYPDKIENGQKKAETLLAGKFLNATNEKYAIACLDYLVFFGPKAATAIPTLRGLFKDGRHTQKTPSALHLAKAIGKDCHVLVPEFTRMITKPRINGFVGNQQQAKELGEFILSANNNKALRDALAATGEEGAKALSRNLLDPDPVVKAFSLLALEAMGRDAKPAMAMIYRSTVPANEKNRAVLFIAQVVYGRLQTATGARN